MADDWDKPTVIRKSRTTARDARSTSAVNQAMASGNVMVQKKSNECRFPGERCLMRLRDGMCRRR